MKALFSVLICAVSIQATANSYVTDKQSAGFKFSQDVQLAPASDSKDFLSAKLELTDDVYSDESARQILSVYPGAPIEQETGCIIKREVGSDNMKSTLIRGSSSQWTIQMKKREKVELNETESQINKTVLSKIGFKGVLEYKQVRYNEEVELKNEEGKVVTLACKRAQCIETYSFGRLKASCDGENMMGRSTSEILRALGVVSKTQDKKEVIVLTKSKSNSTVPPIFKSMSESIKRETAQ